MTAPVTTSATPWILQNSAVNSAGSRTTQTPKQGCATASNTYLANGEQGLSIDCSGEASSWASCYEKADASCAGTGYRIVGTEGTPSLKESEKTLGVDVGNFKSRSVVVVCK